jgi:hypothetical protein
MYCQLVSRVLINVYFIPSMELTALKLDTSAMKKQVRFQKMEQICFWTYIVQ